MPNNIRVSIPSTARINVVTTSKNKIAVSQAGGAIGGGKGATTLRQLTDVNATTAADGQVLVYEAAQGKFVIETLPRLDGGQF